MSVSTRLGSFAARNDRDTGRVAIPACLVHRLSFSATGRVSGLHIHASGLVRHGDCPLWVFLPALVFACARETDRGFGRVVDLVAVSLNFTFVWDLVYYGVSCGIASVASMSGRKGLL